MEILNWDELLLPYFQTVNELTVKLQSLSNGYDMLLDQNSPIERVTGRVKSIASIIEKGKRKYIPQDKIFEEIEDIAGIRIITRFIGDIENVIKLIKERDGRDLHLIKERDYITQTKPSGYRSYHLFVKYPVITVFGYSETICEIQIRTMNMDFWATVEHSLRYKYKGNIPEHIQERLLSTSHAVSRLDNEMNEIREEILNAQSDVDKRASLINEILRNIQELHYNSKLQQVEELNREFYEIYETGSIDTLNEFNRQLNLMREIYRA